MKHLFTIFVIFITVCYFTIGIFNTFNYGPTVDEYAHIGATQSNSRGIAKNVEHPILLKTINAIAIRLQFKNFTPTEIEQYKLGNQFLLESNYKGLDILRSSRLIYLIFNFLPLLILFWLSQIGLLERKIFVWFSVFYVFSVSLISNSNLLTFDIAGSWTALLFIILNWIIFQKYPILSTRNKYILATLLIITLSLALNTKFSNILLIPILGLCNITVAIFWIKNRNSKFLRYYITTSLISIIFFYISIFLLYKFSFGNSEFIFGRHTVIDKNWLFSKYYDLVEWSLRFGRPVQALLEPIKWYMGGLGSVLLRSGEPSYTSFFYKENINKTFLEYNFGLIPFKENPAVLLTSLLIIPVTCWNWYKMIKSKVKINRKQIFNIIFQVIIFGVFPLIYLLISKDSRLTIGYRHFFPVLIFVYFGLAILSAKYFSKLTTSLLIGLIIAVGLIGMPQNLGYVNNFWTDEKWLLVNDSSYNWGQENYRAFKYVYDNYYEDLKTASSKDVEVAIFGSFNFGRELQLIDKDLFNPNLSQPTFEPKYFTENLIDNRIDYKTHSKIVIIDSEVIQKLYLCKGNNPICKANFAFFQNTKPVYSRNEIIFVYKLG